MKKLLGIVVLGLFVFLQNTSYAETKNPLKELESVLGKTFKNLSGKTLNKKDTKNFVLNFAITMKDERNDGIVTYVFKENEYSRYKDFKIISTDGWRFTNTGSLRIFDGDIKLTWKIKLDKKIDNKNVIKIKPKFDPIGNLYEFTYKTKDEFLNDIKEHEKRIKREKIEEQKKIDEEKERLKQEKIDVQKKAEEEKLKLLNELEDQKLKLGEEKLKLLNELEDQKLKLGEEKHKFQKELEDQKLKFGEEKLKHQKELEEQKLKLEVEKLKLLNELEDQKLKFEVEKLKHQKEIDEQNKKLEEERLYNQLEPKFRRKCDKKIFNELYEIDSPEYRTCILNKGPEKQIEEKNKLEIEKKAKEEKEKLESQKKAEEERVRLEKEKLEAQKKAEEEERRVEEEKKRYATWKCGKQAVWEWSKWELDFKKNTLRYQFYYKNKLVDYVDESYARIVNKHANSVTVQGYNKKGKFWNKATFKFNYNQNKISTIDSKGDKFSFTSCKRIKRLSNF